MILLLVRLAAPGREASALAWTTSHAAEGRARRAKHVWLPRFTGRPKTGSTGKSASPLSTGRQLDTQTWCVEGTFARSSPSHHTSLRAGMSCVAPAPPATHVKHRAASRGDAPRTRAVPVSRRAWSTSLALATVGLPTSEALAAANSTDTAPGLTRVVLKTASILPETAADYLVSALGLRLLTADEDEAVGRGRIVVGEAGASRSSFEEAATMPTSHPARSPSFRASLRHLVWRACSSRARTPPSQGTRRCAPAPYRSAPAPGPRPGSGAPGTRTRAALRTSSVCRFPSCGRARRRFPGAEGRVIERGRAGRSGVPRGRANGGERRVRSAGGELELLVSASFVVSVGRAEKQNATRRRRSRRRGRAVRRRRERRRPGAIRRGRGRRRGFRGRVAGVATRGACWRWKRGAERSTRRGENAPNRFRTVRA